MKVTVYVPTGLVKEKKTIEWFHTACGNAVEVDDSIKVEHLMCRKCNNRVMLMPQGLLNENIDYREV